MHTNTVAVFAPPPFVGDIPEVVRERAHFSLCWTEEKEVWLWDALPDDALAVRKERVGRVVAELMLAVKQIAVVHRRLEPTMRVFRNLAVAKPVTEFTAILDCHIIALRKC